MLNTFCLVYLNPIVIGADHIQFYCELSPVDLEYKLDNVVLDKWEVDDSWKDDVDAKIDALRKRDVTINFIDIEATELELDIVQETHKFPFGHAVISQSVIYFDKNIHPNLV